MVNQTPDILIQRIEDLMNRNFISKKDMAKRLNVDYSTFWRKANGKRSIDVVSLLNIASILGTTAGYLLGETNSSLPSDGDVSKENQLPIDIMSPELGSKEKFYQETPGQLVFECGDIHIEVPDTPSNQAWFRSMAQNYLMHGGSVKK